MVSTVTPYTDIRNRAYAGEGFDGVVRVAAGGYYGTGVLLYDGHAVLTAAHLFANSSSVSASVFFETTAGQQTVTATRITPLLSYDAAQGNDDLALVWLSSNAPVTAERYNLYRNSDEIGKTLTMAGYGLPGTGAAGELTSYSGNPIRLKASNQFDAEASTLKSWLGPGMGWTPKAGSQLIADFDNGTTAQDALGRLINLHGTGLGQDEGLVAPGDSGGPAFIYGQVAGIASYTASLQTSYASPDIDRVTNSSFGEVAAWQRVSYYQQWIDQNLRAQLPNAPPSRSRFKKRLQKAAAAPRMPIFCCSSPGCVATPISC